MKIRVYCEATVYGNREGQRWERAWMLNGFISAPCLPSVGSELWFLDDVEAHACPPNVTACSTFHETKKGVFEPQIHMTWEIRDGYPYDATLEEAAAYFKENVLPGLISRGWKMSAPLNSRCAS